jgi:glycosyltransferase involved in cell wall biosynthesis
MKVLLLADAGSVHTEKWAIGLASKGISVGIFSFNRMHSNWIDNHVNIVLLYQPKSAISGKKTSEKLRYFSYLYKLKSAIKAFEPNILHAHYASSYGLMGAITGFHPYIVSVWGTDVYSFPKESWSKKWILQYVLRKAKVICSTSKNMANEISAYTQKNASIIPFGIDTGRFKRKHIYQETRILFGTVKALEEVYGIDRLIRAFHYFVTNLNSNAGLIIYGSGSQEQSLRQLVNELELYEKVDFRGFVCGDALIHAYEQMDIFMALSRSESFGVAVLEASAMQLPVIASNVGGLKEVVSDSQTGFLVDGDDLNEVISRMRLLSENQKLRLEMGVRGRQLVMKYYDFQVNLREQTNVYHEVMIKN